MKRILLPYTVVLTITISPTCGHVSVCKAPGVETFGFEHFLGHFTREQPGLMNEKNEDTCSLWLSVCVCMCVCVLMKISIRNKPRCIRALSRLSSCISDLFSVVVKVRRELSPSPLMSANVTAALLILSYRKTPT